LLILLRHASERVRNFKGLAVDTQRIFLEALAVG
jgi:hypothetical protein